MVATITPNNNFHFALNWFDVALVLALAIGFWRGRRRGMTKELLPCLQWISILAGAAFGHIYFADWLEQQGLVRKVFGNHFDERTAALMSAYLLIMAAILFIFALLRRKFSPKLEGSNIFGNNEYYWGIGAGIVRYSCMLLVGLALLNAPYYSALDIKDKQAYNNRWYGGGLKGYNGDFIPTVYEVQDSVFKKSLVGPYIKEDLSLLLINSRPATQKTAHS